jgi:hypothetical protein
LTQLLHVAPAAQVLPQVSQHVAPAHVLAQVSPHVLAQVPPHVLAPTLVGQAAIHETPHVLALLQVAPAIVFEVGQTAGLHVF